MPETGIVVYRAVRDRLWELGWYIWEYEPLDPDATELRLTILPIEAEPNDGPDPS